MTRSRARHLNYEVRSFLMLHNNINEDGMLLKSCFDGQELDELQQDGSFDGQELDEQLQKQCTT